MKNIRIAILGASFTTGNLGVSALAESSIRCILNRWPNAEILFLGGDQCAFSIDLDIEGRSIQLENIPIRFSKKIYLPNHFLVYFLFAIIRLITPKKMIQKYIIEKNRFIKAFIKTDFVLDITGGDSFSDIYGMRRFYFGFLPKCLVLIYNKPLIFLPQTYGPFERTITRILARFVIGKAHAVYSRDEYSMLILDKLFGSKKTMLNDKIRLVPDVAFIMPPLEPTNLGIRTNYKRVKNECLIGFNISGLLYHGGYTRDNMFELKVDYRELVYSIIELFMKIHKAKIILIPHVIPDIPSDMQGLVLEDDVAVCRDVYEKCIKKYPDRLFIADGKYNHREIKYIIGLCDFFLGSRMHSCIAALSQCIPAVGMAYSRKFKGVFATVGVENCVVDMKNETQEELMRKVSEIFNDRENIASHLQSIMPDIKKIVIGLLNMVDL